MTTRTGLSSPGERAEYRITLHVRLVTWDDDPPLGGQGVYVRELRTELSRLGLTVSTLAGRGPFALRYPRVTNRPHLDMSVALNRSVDPLITGRPDVLHLSGGPGGLQLLRRLEVPVVFTAHHTFRQSRRLLSVRRAYGLVEARSYALASAVAAVSPSTALSLVSAGVPPEKVVVISPGVRTDPGGMTGEEREPGRMLFVGRLEADKRPLDALGAMDEVARSVRGARGYVVGSGSMAAEVSRAARSTSGRVTFLGRIDDESVACEYRRAQVVMMPSDFEGLGMVALEAMAAGAVVVGYDVVGLRDTLEHNGLLVSHRDLKALASTTTRVLSDAALRQDLAARAFESVVAERSWRRCAREFRDLYLRVVP